MMRFLHKFGPRKLSAAEKSELKKNIFQQLELEEQKPAPVRTMTSRLMIAAAVALVVITGGYLIIRASSHTTKTLLAERTGSNEIKTILLPDSSEVILNANSSLEYSSDLSMSENREVKLVGNAFFRVRKDSKIRPFVVHAQSLDITVLGTELNVDARSAEAEVALISGKVKVAHSTETPVYLLPGDKVRLDTLTKALVQTQTNTLLYSVWTDGKWNFRHTSLAEIGQLLQEYYGIRVVFQNEKSKELYINAVIAVGALQRLIPVLEQTLHLKMVLSGNRLTIE